MRLSDNRVGKAALASSTEVRGAYKCGLNLSGHTGWKAGNETVLRDYKRERLSIQEAVVGRCGGGKGGTPVRSL